MGGKPGPRGFEEKFRTWADDVSAVVLTVAPLGPGQVKCQGCGKELKEGDWVIQLTPPVAPPPVGIRQTFGNHIFCSKACLVDWLKKEPQATYDGFTQWVESRTIPI